MSTPPRRKTIRLSGYDYSSPGAYFVTICTKNRMSLLARIDVGTVTSRFIGTFKRFCNREYGRNIWQSRSYDHIIRSQSDYDDVWTYIENNPAK